MRTVRSVVAAASLVAALGLTAPFARAIGSGTDIPDTDFPSVGIVRVTGFYGTGTLIQNNLLPARSWVLTAAHNLDGRENARFIPKGSSGTTVSATNVYIHPGFTDGSDLTEDNDIALMRLESVINGVTPSQLYRNQVAVGETYTLVGFGDPQTNNLSPQKRKGDFRIDALSTNKKKMQSLSPTPPEGQQRRPVGGTGDSGGPWFDRTDFKVAGVHESGDGPSSVRDPIRSSATAVFPYLDYIDSYTQRGVFWDNLRIEAQPVMLADSVARADPPINDYFSGAFANGLSEGWQRTAVQAYPGEGGSVDVPVNTNARPIEAVGHNNGATPEETLPKSQGLLPTGTTPYIIKKVFNVDVPAGNTLSIEIDNLFNSLLLGSRFGVQLDADAIMWDDFRASVMDNLDMWSTRSLGLAPTAGPHEVTVYLSTTVPAPGCATVLALAPALLARRRRAAA